MDKERAKEILMAHACCSFATTNNELCKKCPWNNTNDCDIEDGVYTKIDEKVIIEAMRVLRGECI